MENISVQLEQKSLVQQRFSCPSFDHYVRSQLNVDVLDSIENGSVTVMRFGHLYAGVLDLE